MKTNKVFHSIVLASLLVPLTHQPHIKADKGWVAITITGIIAIAGLAWHGISELASANSLQNDENAVAYLKESIEEFEYRYELELNSVLGHTTLSENDMKTLVKHIVQTTGSFADYHAVIQQKYNRFLELKYLVETQKGRWSTQDKRSHLCKEAQRILLKAERVTQNVQHLQTYLKNHNGYFSLATTFLNADDQATRHLVYLKKSLDNGTITKNDYLKELASLVQRNYGDKRYPQLSAIQSLEKKRSHIVCALQKHNSYENTNTTLYQKTKSALEQSLNALNYAKEIITGSNEYQLDKERQNNEQRHQEFLHEQKKQTAALEESNKIQQEQNSLKQREYYLKQEELRQERERRNRESLFAPEKRRLVEQICNLERTIKRLHDDMQRIQDALNCAHHSNSQLDAEKKEKEKKIRELESKLRELKNLIHNPPINPENPDYLALLRKKSK